MKTKIVGFCICMLLIAAVVLSAAGATNKIVTNGNKVSENQTSMEFAPGEFIVKIKQDRTFSSPALIALNAKYQVNSLEKVFPNAEGSILDNIYLLHVPIGSDILSVVREYTSCPDVVYAEPNGRDHYCSTPNDVNFSNQWHLNNIGQVICGNISGKPDADIDAPEAWDMQKGSPNVVIAIIDSGIDYTHPDLAANIWNNTDEIPGNGIDDDHNGYIDDVRGWDFYYNDSNVTDGSGHGTMCAGDAGAVTDNGIWGAGVSWNCKIMPVRIANESWYTTTTYGAKGIRYAADNGASIISMSFGGNTVYNIVRDAVNYAYGKGVFLCAAAGNSNTSTKMYPAAYENVTAVAATNQNDGRCTSKDWGAWGGLGSDYGNWVDIAAPGNLVFSTAPTYHVKFSDPPFNWQLYYCFGGGTSSASPIVAGVAALLLSKDPSLTPDQVKALLCGNVDPYNSTVYIGSGRLNAQKALAALQFSEGVKIKGGLGVSMVMTNNGPTNLINISWQIHVKGGIIGLINKTVNGKVDIKAGASQTVSTGMLLGFGGITINAMVAGVEKTAKGTQIIFYSIVKK